MLEVLTLFLQWFLWGVAPVVQLTIGILGLVESVPQNESVNDEFTESVTEKASELAEWVAGPAAQNKYENSASDKYGERIDTGDGGDNSGSKFTVGQGMGDTGYSGSGGASRPDFQYQR